MPSEADTCRKFVVPLLQAAGWDSDPHPIAEQRTITDGRIVPVGKGFIRKPPKRVDYLLRYRRDFPLAVRSQGRVQTPRRWPATAKQYAEMLGPPDVKWPKSALRDSRKASFIGKNQAHLDLLGRCQTENWRRGRDSNPRRAINPRTLSRRVT